MSANPFNTGDDKIKWPASLIERPPASATILSSTDHLMPAEVLQLNALVLDLVARVERLEADRREDE